MMTPEEQLVGAVISYVTTLWDMGWFGQGTLLVSLCMVGSIVWDWSRPCPGSPVTVSTAPPSDPLSGPSSEVSDSTPSNEPLWLQDYSTPRPAPTNGIAPSGSPFAEVPQIIGRWVSESEGGEEA